MSVLTDSNQYASSTRVRAVFRYLARANNNSEARNVLERRLSPETLVRGDKTDAPSLVMVKGTINECIKMDLVGAEGERLYLNPSLTPEERHPVAGDALLPLTLARLLTVDRNSDKKFSSLVAWYLAQDAYAAPGTWPEVDKKIKSQGVSSHLPDMNDARYSQFEDWVCYLGFAWKHALNGKKVLTPDPTIYLRGRVAQMFDGREDQHMPLGEFITSLATGCSVFETGEHRNRIEELIRPRAERHLSSTTALGLLRLHEEGLLELTVRGDAELFVLPDGARNQSFSHVRLRQPGN